MRMRSEQTRNVLVIGDLHEPFGLDAYLDFCIEQYKKWNCTQTIFIGDIIDNHYSSYHETSADGMGGLDELELAIKRIARWRNAFPIATVVVAHSPTPSAVKTTAFSNGEGKIMIVSSDKDFLQLQKYYNVFQYSPIQKKNLQIIYLKILLENFYKYEKFFT